MADKGEPSGSISGRSSSFLYSLGDDELIEFLQKLSQDRKLKTPGTKAEVATDVDTDPDHMNETDADTDDDSKAPVKRELFPSSPSAVDSNAGSIKKDTGVVVLTSDDPPSTTDEILGSITLAQEPAPASSQIQELLFGDYETYFKEKKLKQLQADLEYKRWDEERRRKLGQNDFTYPPLFRGCIIYVNGRTDPDILQLHKMIVLHGGTFLHYLGAKGNATHIIASNLTPKKHVEFKNYKVVKPDWIVDSITHRRLLPWMDYQVINVAFGQKKLEFLKPEVQETRVDNAETLEEQFELAPTTQEEGAGEEAFQDENIPTDDRGIVDAKHPDFLKYFFSKSRLHHLSTWKADLKYEFLQKALLRQMSTGASKPKLKTTRTIFHVDFDCFFATASALSNSDVDNLKDPIAVTHGGGSADVASCNYVARKFGVKNGMWVRNARKLCPNLICLDYNFDLYEKISRIFYDYMIGLNCDSVLPVSVDEVLLDVTDLCLGDDEKIESLGRQIRQDIYEKTKCTVSVGAASNVLLAKLSLRRSKPDGFFHLKKSDNVDEFLKNVVIRDLPGVGYSISNKLEREIGKQSIQIDVLKKIEKEKLINLFGIKTGTKLYEYARGIDETDINIANNVAEYARKSVSIDINWGIRFDTVLQVDQFLLNCAKEMHSRLLKLKMMGSSVTLKLARRAPSAPIDPPKYLGMGRCDFFTKSARLGVATREIGLISSECKALYRILNVPPVDLRGVSIQITHLVDDDSMERQAQNQRKLPFAKIDKDQFLVETATKIQNTDKDSNNIVIDSSPVILRTQPNSDDSIQYDIPSDIDSSVLKALPDDIRESIEKKRLKRDQPIVSIPAQSQIDWEVVKLLPLDIQRELKSVLKRRDIPILNKPETPPVSPFKRKSPRGKFYMQPVFPKDGEGPTAVRVISPSKNFSPRKRVKSRHGSPSAFNLEDLDIDENVLDELPSSVRRDLINDLKAREELEKDKLFERDMYEKLEIDIDEDMNKTRPKRTIQITKTLFNEITNFQNKPHFLQHDSFNSVKSKITEWISATIHTGPENDDVVAFNIFITRLLQHSLSNCINYLKIINSTIRIERSLLRLHDEEYGLQVWSTLLQRFKAIVDDKCVETGISYDINE